MKNAAFYEMASTMNRETVLEQIQSRGYAILRGAFPRDQILNIGKKMEAELELLQQARLTLPEEMRKSLDRSEMPVHDKLARFRLDPSNYSHLTNSTILKEALIAILGEAYVWHYPTMFRKISPRLTDGFLPFHQDYTYNTHYSHLYTVWVPLNDCGVKAPSISIVGQNTIKKFQHASEGKWEHGIPDEQLQDILFGAPIIDLTFEAGDVAIFGELILHRTFSIAGMDQSRLSMDARAVPISCIPLDARKKRKFIAFDSPELVEVSI
jgi:hypothetical protein